MSNILNNSMTYIYITLFLHFEIDHSIILSFISNKNIKSILEMYIDHHSASNNSPQKINK